MRNTVFAKTLFLVLGLASTTSAYAQPAPPPTAQVQRFTCNRVAVAKFVKVAGLDGFGAMNQSVQTSIVAQSGGLTPVQAGYVITPTGNLQPPTTSTGFRQFTANIRIERVLNSIPDGRVQFTFRFESGPDVVVTKTFAEMDPRPADSIVKVISANSLEFGGLNVRAANLVKVVVYLTKTDSTPALISLGECTIESGQGIYDINKLVTKDAGCQLK